MRIKTKIVCTMGPAVDSDEKLAQLIEAGMNVARINFSHGTHEQHLKTINRLKAAREKSQRPLAIMLDTKGPEVRIGQLPHGPREVNTGDQLRLLDQEAASDPTDVPILPTSVISNLTVGSQVLFNDGYIRSRVIANHHDHVIVEVESGGLLESGKGINVPDVVLDLPMITERDKADIQFGCEHDVDWVAASFVNAPEHILSMKHLLATYGRPEVQVIAKIETSRGVNALDDILQVADGIMVARGDLGVEVPLSKVPGLQKMMIRKCFHAAKPSVTATQMLETMITNPRPTRAEASDVANAIFDSTSAVMLSGETAVGKFPIETVSTMASIVEQAEVDFDYATFMHRDMSAEYQDVRTAVTVAAAKTALRAKTKAIFVVTSTGRAARLLSRLRPPQPILALTFSKKVYNQLALHWGVVPIYTDTCSTLEDGRKFLSDWALENGYVRYGDLVVLAAGMPYGLAGSTNMMILDSIGDVLIRGQPGCGQRYSGVVELVFNPEEVDPAALHDKIVVTTKCDDTYLPLLKNAGGVILQTQPDDHESERYLLLVGRALNLSAVLRADGACSTLESGQTVTIDPIEGIVFNGIVD